MFNHKYALKNVQYLNENDLINDWYMISFKYCRTEKKARACLSYFQECYLNFPNFTEAQKNKFSYSIVFVCNTFSTYIF